MRVSQAEPASDSPDRMRAHEARARTLRQGSARNDFSRAPNWSICSRFKRLPQSTSEGVSSLTEFRPSGSGGWSRQPELRVPGHYGVFTTPEFKSSRLFIQAHPTELPSALGGGPENDDPPEGLRCENWRSLLQEAKWRGWTGLEFEMVWRDG